MQSVAALLEDAGTITYRKMFGEYCGTIATANCSAAFSRTIACSKITNRKAFMPDGKLELPQKGKADAPMSGWKTGPSENRAYDQKRSRNPRKRDEHFPAPVFLFQKKTLQHGSVLSGITDESDSIRSKVFGEDGEV